jgi:hypothetical protein
MEMMATAKAPTLMKPTMRGGDRLLVRSELGGWDKEGEEVEEGCAWDSVGRAEAVSPGDRLDDGRKDMMGGGTVAKGLVSWRNASRGDRLRAHISRDKKKIWIGPWWCPSHIPRSHAAPLPQR